MPIDAGQSYGLLASNGSGEQTVRALFPRDTDSFRPGEAPLTINYRARDLDAMLAQVRAAAAEVDGKVDEYGRFGWAIDPEGNRFEISEPR